MTEEEERELKEAGQIEELSRQLKSCAENLIDDGVVSAPFSANELVLMRIKYIEGYCRKLKAIYKRKLKKGEMK